MVRKSILYTLLMKLNRNTLIVIEPPATIYMGKDKVESTPWFTSILVQPRDRNVDSY